MYGIQTFYMTNLKILTIIVFELSCLKEKLTTSPLHCLTASLPDSLRPPTGRKRGVRGISVTRHDILIKFGMVVRYAEKIRIMQMQLICISVTMVTRFSLATGVYLHYKKFSAKSNILNITFEQYFLFETYYCAIRVFPGIF